MLILRRALIVGLGNPGPQYATTRHNAGFMLLDLLSSGFTILKEINAAVMEVDIEGMPSILMKPLTYMNRSGSAVKAAMSKWQIARSDLLVICDDIYLPVGKTRIRAKGSSAGHNGLLDIERALGSREYWRIKIGVDEPKEGEELDRYVLASFPEHQKEDLKQALHHACDQVRQWVSGRIIRAEDLKDLTQD